jgi:hypothetical protein
MNAVVKLISSDIKLLFGRPPLLIGEDQLAYDTLLSQIAASIDPKDAIEWLLTKDYADLTWEMQRMRRVKAGMIDAKRKEAVVSILNSILEEKNVEEGRNRTQEAEIKADQWFDGGDGKQQIRQHMEKYDLDAYAITAQAFALRSRELEVVERMLESTERRRSKALFEIEVHRAASARARRTELIEG